MVGGRSGTLLGTPRFDFHLNETTPPTPIAPGGTELIGFGLLGRCERKAVLELVG
jgi:hypothetical protein